MVPAAPSGVAHGGPYKVLLLIGLPQGRAIPRDTEATRERSTNGTRINGLRAKHGRLGAGDELSIAKLIATSCEQINSTV